MGAPDLLQHLRTTGFSVTAAEGGGIRVAPAGALSADQRQAIRDLKPALLALLAATPTINPVPATLVPVAQAGADMAQFQARRERLLRWGWPDDEANALAERLTRRDLTGDLRVSCAECSAWQPGRCRNYRRAGLHSPEVGRDLAELLQHCPGFKA